MREGLYRIHFRAHSQITGTGDQMGAGVVYLHDGIASGGDEAFYYSGKYQLDENRITVTASVKRHTSTSSRSIFGTETTDVKLTGSMGVDGQISAFGETIGTGIRFEVGLRWLAV